MENIRYFKLQGEEGIAALNETKRSSIVINKEEYEEYTEEQYAKVLKNINMQLGEELEEITQQQFLNWLTTK